MLKLSSTHNAFYVHIVNLENTKIQFINEFGDVCLIIFSTEEKSKAQPKVGNIKPDRNRSTITNTFPIKKNNTHSHTQTNI